MVSSDKIKHFIFMRFFSFEDPNYPYDIFDVDFLSKQLVIAKNHALKSLENQTCKNFDLVFIVHEKFFLDKKYEFIFSTLKESTSLPIKFMKMPLGLPNKWTKYKKTDIPRLIKEAANDYDFVIQSRMDFDDFLYKDGIADTQSKVNECDSILAYGYCKGYWYVHEELFPFLRTYKDNGYHSILGSLILKSTFVKQIPFICIYGFNHDQARIKVKEFLETNGLEFRDDMYQSNTSVDAFIYYRHESSHFTATRNAGDPTVKTRNKKSLTSADINKKYLKDEFGFELKLKSIE